MESQFPALSGQAFAAGRKQALDAGLSVLESKDGIIYESFPDGRREVVKEIKPLISVEIGKVYTIQ